jgi:hypothetical protein|tara:strand:+ start:703 stop:1005 length:303 start_codon:yes stop_codon:yes gene_type:complete
MVTGFLVPTFREALVKQLLQVSANGCDTMSVFMHIERRRLSIVALQVPLLVPVKRGTAIMGEKHSKLAFDDFSVIEFGQGICVFTFDEFCSFATVMSIVA